MQQLLHKCLEIHSTTILPEFGAIMKLGSSFVYNEYLKFDDGKLIEFIANERSLSKEEAKSTVLNWVIELKEKLSKGDSVKLEKIGILVFEDDKIQLKKPTSEAPEVITPAPVEKKESYTAQQPVSREESKTNTIDTPQEPKEELTDSNTSSGLSAKMAIASIESFSDKNKLIEYTRGESRKTVIDALNKKLNLLNGKITPISEPALQNEPLEEEIIPANEEVPQEIQSVQDNNQHVPEENTQEIEELIALTENLDSGNQYSTPEKEIVKVVDTPNVETTKKNKPAVQEAPKIVDKEPVTSHPYKQEEDKALEVIAAGVAKLEKEQKKRKRRKIILFAALFCLLSGGGILGYLKKEELMNWYNGEPKQTLVAQKEVPEKDTATTPVTPVEEVVLEEPIDSGTLAVEPIEELIEEEAKETPKEIKPVTTPSSSPTGDFLLVAGSFSKESNATNLVEKLKAEGFSSASMSSSGSMYKVVAGSYASKDAAENAKNDLMAKGLKGYVQKK